MIDFLRSNPWCSKEEYMWGMSVAQVKLASYDFSHVEYLNDKASKAAEEDKNFKTIVLNDDNSAAMLNDLGKPIINNNKIRRK